MLVFGEFQGWVRFQGGKFASPYNKYKIPCDGLGELVGWMQLNGLNTIKDVWLLQIIKCFLQLITTYVLCTHMSIKMHK